MVMTVYNGEDHVNRSLDSVARLRDRTDDVQVDMLVLDDCSPAPGFSQRLSGRCEALGVRYYRSPRNLGIPRNVNLGLLTCLREGYDFVCILNSDILVPQNLVDGMLGVLEQPDIGSVTAWSNNVSIYSLINDDPDAYLAKQEVADWVSASLAGHFGTTCLDIPAGISFCMMVSAESLVKTGLMDPVYGRGYCEEIDWSLRAKQRGLRTVLATGLFVYHAGSGSNVEAGLISKGSSTVEANERIIDLRFPLFRRQVEDFAASGLLEGAIKDAHDVVIRDAGRQFGYQIVLSWLPQLATRDDILSVALAPDGLMATATASFLGFPAQIPIDRDHPLESIRAYFGTEPVGVTALDCGRLQGTPEGLCFSGDAPGYPTQV